MGSGQSYEERAWNAENKVAYLQKVNDELYNAIRMYQRERDANALDAQRYRFLRDRKYANIRLHEVRGGEEIAILCVASFNLDSAIDGYLDSSAPKRASKEQQ
jgi:hypothetical protein